MTDAISIENAKIVAARLKEARATTGLSTRAVADAVQRRFAYSISYKTIAGYEKADGSASPSLRVLGFLAEVYERPLEWFLQKSIPLAGIRYRYTSSRVSVKERHQFEIKAQHWLEAYANLERRINQPLVSQRRIQNYRTKNPVELAQLIRSELKISERDPIFSVVGIMEEFGIRVMELPTESRIDGLAANFGNEIAVVLNPMTSNDRCRMNAGHELFHALSGDCDKGEQTTKAMEDHAYEFACNLLIPQKELRKAFDGMSAVRLVQAKERFGISMAAMVYRAEKSGIIDERTAKKIWIQFARRGWRANEPGSVRADRAIRFETILDEALAKKRIQWSEATALMGVTRSEVEERMRMAMGCATSTTDDEQLKGGSITLKLRSDT